MSHPVTDALASVTDHAERHAIKAAAFVALPRRTRKVTVGEYTVALVDHPVIGPTGLLEFHVKITRNGKDVTPPGMVGPDSTPGHVRVTNPPLWVPDPAGDIVQSWDEERWTQLMDWDSEEMTSEEYDAYEAAYVPERIVTHHEQRFREDLHNALLNIAGNLVRGLP